MLDVEITLDEYTSLKNRKYLNLNSHKYHKSNCFNNLGLSRITELVKLVEEHLNGFGINVNKDIVAIVTDGAEVMK